MTMVVKKAGPNHRSRSRGEEGVFVIDPATLECVAYKELSPKSKYLPLNLELLNHRPELEFRNDFIDCQIDICSVDVPALFTENFDYQEIRKHFVKGILESDILGKKIFCHLIEDRYAARVRNTRMYDSISYIYLGFEHPAAENVDDEESEDEDDELGDQGKENFSKLSLSNAKWNKLVLYFYEEEVFDEDFILGWYEQNKGPFRDALRPFAEWLLRAEEESDDD
ncbi:hypothetical protein HDU96_003022 [Phlyctochytrium bullatum]|nr:hypothetical protein HDU96_003022 [Phlyctochytrium bullatum]